jgi:eukaryotic-like serine/threonine-protein kinase
MSLRAGSSFGPYEIRSVLGTGGMGEVYEAYDSRLRRRIALKTLPPAFAADPARRERFEREAQAVAALNHPNVVTIHSVEQAEGVPFLTMELVDGRPLSAFVSPGGMPLGHLLQLAIPLVDAVSAAHARGITHRDLKPGNILVTDEGRVKVLDFGLAKVSDAAWAIDETITNNRLTGEGRIVGTVGYMSPEQAEGRIVDSRSDLFALGVVLYELATGEPPFQGDTPMSVLSAILKETPAPVTTRRPDLPAELARVIRRCLEKDPARRLQTALDLRNELEEIKATSLPSASSATPLAPTSPAAHVNVTSDAAVLAQILGRHRGVIGAVGAVLLVLAVVAGWRWWADSRMTIDSVAVLPFLNATGNPDSDYLSDGLTDTLTSNLAQIRSLRVVPRTLAASYQDRATDLREIGRSLDVGALVTGRLVQRGDRMILQAQLVDLKTVAQLWGDQMEFAPSDTLAVQKELSKVIAEKLRARLTREDEKTLTSGTTDPVAYQLFLKGQYAFSKRTPVSLAHATQYYQQALDRDPSYALAYVGLAQSFGARATNGYLPAREGYAKSMAASRKAIELDDGLARAHAVLGAAVLNHDWNWSDAEREFRRALALDSEASEVHFLYGAFFLTPIGHLDVAIAELKRAEALDPLAPVVPARLGMVLAYAGRYDEAIDACQRALALEPDQPLGHRFLALAYRLKGVVGAAVAESRRMTELGDANGRVFLGQIYASTGQRRDALALLKDLTAESTTRGGRFVGVAALSAALGDTDQAFTWLDRAFDQRDNGLLSLRVNPDFQGLRNDPRFRKLIEHIGVPPM